MGLYWLKGMKKETKNLLVAFAIIVALVAGAGGAVTGVYTKAVGATYGNWIGIGVFTFFLILATALAIDKA